MSNTQFNEYYSFLKFARSSENPYISYLKGLYKLKLNINVLRVV